MHHLAIDRAGFYIEPAPPRRRSQSAPGVLHCAQPTSPKDRIAFLLPFCEATTAKQAVAQLGAQMVFDEMDKVSKPLLQTACSIRHQRRELSDADLACFLKDLQIDPRRADFMSPKTTTDSAANAAPSLAALKPPRSVKKCANTAQKPVKRRPNRRSIEKRASLFDKQTLLLVGPVLAAAPQQLQATMTLQRELRGMQDTLNRIEARQQVATYAAEAQHASPHLPDWDRQYGLEYIRARWRQRGSARHAPFWKSLGFIALRCLKEAATWVLGLVSLALPIRFFDNGRR